MGGEYPNARCSPRARFTQEGMRTGTTVGPTGLDWNRWAFLAQHKARKKQNEGKRESLHLAISSVEGFPLLEGVLPPPPPPPREEGDGEAADAARLVGVAFGVVFGEPMRTEGLLFFPRVCMGDPGDEGDCCEGDAVDLPLVDGDDDAARFVARFPLDLGEEGVGLEAAPRLTGAVLADGGGFLGEAAGARVTDFAVLVVGGGILDGGFSPDFGPCLGAPSVRRMEDREGEERVTTGEGAGIPPRLP